MTGLVTVDGGVPAGSAGTASAGSAGGPEGTLSGSPRDDVSSFSLVLHADGLAGPIMVRAYGCSRPGPGNRAKPTNHTIVSHHALDMFRTSATRCASGGAAGIKDLGGRSDGPDSLPCDYVRR